MLSAVLTLSSFAGCAATGESGMGGEPSIADDGVIEGDASVGAPDGPEVGVEEDPVPGDVNAEVDPGVGADEDAGASEEGEAAFEPLVADCPLPGHAVVYTQDNWNVLADAFAVDPSPCVHYYISIPALAGAKTTPRGGGEPERMRARGRQLHAMAEFHYWGWADAPGTWYERGVEFRRRMETAGYRVDQGDTWAINELPSAARRDGSVRRQIMELMRGLHDGPPGARPVRGAAFVIGMAHATANVSVYEPQVKEWLAERAFWENANRHVRFWAQEVYADPMRTCTPGTATGARSSRLNQYVEHFARLAEVGPDTANTAQSYLGRAYVPLMNGMFRSPAGVYGDTQISLDQMMHFVSQEVYAARAWASSHAYPDGRVGFAWGRYEGTVEQQQALAARIASAIRHAYGEGGGSASRACSPSGAYTWCQCSLSGARFHDAWASFDRW